MENVLVLTQTLESTRIVIGAMIAGGFLTSMIQPRCISRQKSTFDDTVSGEMGWKHVVIWQDVRWRGLIYVRIVDLWQI